MIKNQAYINPGIDIGFELMQSADEGKDITSFEKEAEEIKALDDGDINKILRAEKLCEALRNAPVMPGYRYNEPSDLETIKAQRPAERYIPQKKLSDEELLDKIYGAWLARCAGCLLGKPVEGWTRAMILEILEATGNYPINNYISYDKIPREIHNKRNINPNAAWLEHIDSMPEDDDTNYTAIGLKIVETYGHDFTPDDVAEAWLNNLPLLHTFTAERVAYKNFVNLIAPPESAAYCNPFREWIGAQIRADFYGYINPYSTENAANMAFRDACISHTKNGIYGEMFVAAAISAAFTCDNMEKVIYAGLSEIPQNSRLRECIIKVIDLYHDGKSYLEIIDLIYETYSENTPHGWVHTLPNAMIVCTALLCGDNDLEKTIGIAVEAGFDTDCNGATSASIVGAMIGAQNLSSKWISPLNDTLHSGIDGFGTVSIFSLAERTVKLTN